MLRSSTTSYYQADGLGSITSLSNGSGSLAQTYTFDSFGKQTGSTGSLTNPFQYTARESDPETGLYFYRARYYDPTIGRFISEDPIRFAGSASFYTYTHNWPVDATDPSGLKILLCSRDAETMPGNHAFLYDTRNGDNCGKGRGNHPTGHENINNPGTFCREVPGSEGREDAVMKCCRQKSSSFLGRFFFFPGMHDCQNLVVDCLKENGLSNPGVPGGRLRCRSGSCPEPSPALGPYARDAYTRWVLRP